jgi:hypothetical protein
MELIKDGSSNADEIQGKLSAEGFQANDISRIIFTAYEDLLGEVESRGTQAQMRIPANLTNYFYLNEWEKSPTRNIAVIGGDYMVADSEKIMAAVEKHGDHYILHFKKTPSCVPFIHELGHIVHDILLSRGNGDAILATYNEATTQDNYDEYFAHCFLGYLLEKMPDSILRNDLKMDFSIKTNAIISNLLNEIFNFTEIKSDKMSYLKTVENLI